VLRSYLACSIQRFDSVSKFFVQHLSILDRVLKEGITLRNHFIEFSRCVNKYINGKIGINNLYNILDSVEKTFFGFLDDNQIDVAVRVKSLFSPRNEKDDFLSL
jgi:hypothetical protein